MINFGVNPGFGQRGLINWGNSSFIQGGPHLVGGTLCELLESNVLNRFLKGNSCFKTNVKMGKSNSKPELLRSK